LADVLDDTSADSTGLAWGCVTPGGKSANNNEKKFVEGSAEVSTRSGVASLRGAKDEKGAKVITANKKEQSWRRRIPTLLVINASTACQEIEDSEVTEIFLIVKIL
jgi:hypothetical protein